MHIEITQAVDFLGRLLNSKLENGVVDRFKERLIDLLKERFEEHWDPQQPSRGNGYRAISNFNGMLDPILTTASIQASIQPNSIHTHLPRDFVLWIDPYSVSYRVGENSNIMTLFEDVSCGKSSPSSPTVSFIQPRTSTPIRISPPNSPESVVLNKKNINNNKGLVMAA